MSLMGVQRIAVADLGTNSTRLLVADLTTEGELVEVERLSEVTRLGQGVDSSGRLAEEAMERVHECLARYRETADRHGAEHSVAVATSAVRDAANGPEFARSSSAASHRRFSNSPRSGCNEC